MRCLDNNGGALCVLNRQDADRTCPLTIAFARGMQKLNLDGAHGQFDKAEIDRI